MFNRIFAFCIVAIISQYVLAIPYAHSQGEMTQEQEFDILLKEVLLPGFISLDVPNFKEIQGKKIEEIKKIIIIDQIKGNARNILYGDELVPEDTLDIMDFSLEWWKTHSKIYGIMKDDKNKGEAYLWKLVQAKAGSEPPDPVPPNPLDLRKPISKKTRDEIPPITEPTIKPLALPDLTWLYPTKEPVAPSYDGSGLFKLSAWRNTKEIHWKEDASVAMIAGGVAYLLSRLSKSKEKKDFAYHPSEGPKPICWTACALGEPIWKRSPIPSGITLEEWRQRSDLQMWYPTPPIIIVEDKPSWYIPAGRDVSIAISTHYASRAVYSFFRSKFFPIRNFPE